MHRRSFLAAASGLVAAGCAHLMPARPAAPLSLLPDGADQATLPFELQDGFILLKGEVRGVQGVFLFDTGTPFTLLLNNTVVPMNPVGPGSPAAAGSGQKFTIHRHDDAGPIRIADQHFAATGPLISGDTGWLTREFRPDFLGFAGYALVRAHEMVIDYPARQIALYRLGPDGEPRVAHTPDRRGAIRLPFEGFDRGRANLPYVMTKLAGEAIEVMFDTGAEGYLELTPASHRALDAAGVLKPAGAGLRRLDGLTLGGHRIDNRFRTVSDDKPANRLTMGAASLALYRSIWNYRKGEITLLPLPRQAAVSGAR